jgi:hypothetical protein
MSGVVALTGIVCSGEAPPEQTGRLGFVDAGTCQRDTGHADACLNNDPY